MANGPSPSFSVGRKWSLSLNVLVSTAAALALALMVNYASARHFYKRFQWSNNALAKMSPQTLAVLKSLTNEVRVIVYYDSKAPLYDSVVALLKEYKTLSPRISVQITDYKRDSAAGELVKAAYKLSMITDKDLVIFDCNGKSKFVDQSELSDVDLQPLITGKSREVKRTTFKGELLFTSAILNVTSARALRAYFLEGHGEQSPESTEAQFGFSKFATVLKQNNIVASRLTLLGTNEVPSDCSLLIIAGPSTPMAENELGKIDQYLSQGGRLLALFNFYGLNKNPGLERILAGWGVAVGNDVVRDIRNSTAGSRGQDVITSAFSEHPIVKPLYETRLHMIVPRSISRVPGLPGTDAPTVEALVFTSAEGSIVTDIRDRVPYPHVTDLVTNVPLAVAVEKGSIPNLSAERGTTRMVVVGDSVFLGNQMIDSAANRDFAQHAVNWLLDRSVLLAVPPRPIKEFKLTMTKSQLAATQWILLAGMPGFVLLVGLGVWVRRRN
jgi:ABC-2 type transport system permease protein